MRKLWITLVALLLAVSSVGACAEEREAILFRGIPWLCSIDEAVELMLADESVPDGRLRKDETMYSWGLDWLEVQAENGGFTYTISGSGNKLFVAGYSVSECYLRALYGHSSDAVSRASTDSCFYQAKYYFDVDDVAAVYADLSEKLSIMYGSPAFQSESTDKPYAAWYGSDGTGVFLDARYGSLSLCYGLVNADEMIGDLNEAFRQENLKTVGGLYDGL